MSYSQKKKALKNLLMSANSKDKSVSQKENIRPLAVSLLQALKEKRPTLKPSKRPQLFSKHLKESQTEPRPPIIRYQESKTVKKPLFKEPTRPVKIVHNHKPKPTYKPRKNPSKGPQKFSPPSNLDSGFTPFFKSSKYFDEDKYFENLTTTEQQIETTEETTTTTITEAPARSAFYQPPRNYGEKTLMQQKSFIKPYYTTFKPKQYPSKPGRYNYQQKQSTTAPSSSSGFLDDWGSIDQDFLYFNSQKQNTEPLKAVKYESERETKPYFNEWDRKQEESYTYRTRKQEYYQPLVVEDTRYSEEAREDTRYSEEAREDTRYSEEARGFMDSQPFSLPQSFESSFENEPQNINGYSWDREFNPGPTTESSVSGSRFLQTERLKPFNKYERSLVEKTNTSRNYDKKRRYMRPSSRDKEYEVEFGGDASFRDDFSFSDSNLGEFFDDISDTFPDVSEFGPSWESLKF